MLSLSSTTTRRGGDSGRTVPTLFSYGRGNQQKLKRFRQRGLSGISAKRRPKFLVPVRIRKGELVAANSRKDATWKDKSIAFADPELRAKENKTRLARAIRYPNAWGCSG